MAKRKGPSKAKAEEILKDGTVHGKKLSEKQRGFMTVIAGGKTPSKAKKARKKGY